MPTKVNNYAKYGYIEHTISIHLTIMKAFPTHEGDGSAYTLMSIVICQPSARNESYVGKCEMTLIWNILVTNNHASDFEILSENII